MKALLIGQGAREHAIAESLVNSGSVLYAYMKTLNPGIARLSKYVKVGSLSNFTDIVEFARNVDFCIIGPEDPLAEGVVDRLEDAGVPCVGPSRTAARLESSKSFTRLLLTKYKIPGNPEYRVFEDMKDVREYIQTHGSVVVKPDGLTGGKGVKVWGEHLNNIGEAEEYIRELIERDGKVVVEEKLDGEEFTLQAFVDGVHVVGSPLVQDHKRAYEGDQGPNTGGMGSYSFPDHSLPFIDSKYIPVALDILKKTVAAVKKETGIPYKGVLYGQFMLTRNGLRVVEFNARFGDPEAINILPILKTSFTDICLRILDGTLSEKHVEFDHKATVVKYLAPVGYPVSPVPSEVTVNEEGIKNIGGRVYYASVSEKNERILTTSSRSIAVLGVSSTIEEAERIAEESICYIGGELFHRRDIGTRKLIQKRIDHMKQLLS
ncbi:MAG: phosphoribosylamine--glycine ligase [Candidatus Odinarchaeum yellowstonii]|uniref:Phosphoribosylamine--glycine ligase n=1 Tax=Odinarchaeota yellowstonii (strain LCB_4) TaxID=1841599 RepID=A0AAF0D3M3_ODILC|nr:MAG: phosphoribosylamine--glycine ligase [Candidatus Odinarchaeum yellowstonii]